jgi:hypothetical protein
MKRFNSPGEGDDLDADKVNFFFFSYAAAAAVEKVFLL